MEKLNNYQGRKSLVWKINEIIDWINGFEAFDGNGVVIKMSKEEFQNFVYEPPPEKKCENCKNDVRGWLSYHEDCGSTQLRSNFCKNVEFEDCLTNNYKYFEPKQ